MDRPTKRFAARLVAGFAGLATALTGCGGNEPTKTATTTPPAASTTVASSPATVDYNDPAELARALATIDVEVSAPEPIERDRAGGYEGLIFPTWPSGEVRKAGLSTYRVDVAPEFDGKAKLKFLVNKKVVFEGPFEPANLSTESAIPAIVLESLKAGDQLTWGVYPEGKKVKAATLDAKVIEKAGATRKLSQTDSEKALSPMARAFAKANVLQNNGFLSESVMTFVAIGKADSSITSVYAPIVGLLRRLHLKNTPLFHDAMARATAVTPSGPGRQAFNTQGSGGGTSDLGPKSPGFVKQNPPVVASNANAKKPGLKGPGGTGLPGLPSAEKPKVDGPTDTTSTGVRVGHELALQAANMRRGADQAAEHAKRLEENATLLRANADSFVTKAAELTAKADELAAKAQDMSLPEGERTRAAIESDMARAEAAQARAQAEILGARATDAENQAAGAKLRAEHLDQQADTLQQHADAAGVAISGLPGSSVGGPISPPGQPQGPLHPQPTPPAAGPSHQQLLESLRTVMTAAQAAVGVAIGQVTTAQAAVAAAQAAHEAAPSDATVMALNLAQNDLNTALRAKEEAERALVDVTNAFQAENAKGG
jgi:hypothetical protein